MSCGSRRRSVCGPDIHLDQDLPSLFVRLQWRFFVRPDRGYSEGHDKSAALKPSAERPIESWQLYLASVPRSRIFASNCLTGLR